MKVMTNQGSDVPAWVSVLGAVGVNLADIHMLIQIGIGIGALLLVWLRVWDGFKKRNQEEE